MPVNAQVRCLVGAVCSAVLVATFAATSRAQVVTGRVVESVSTLPVTRGVILLLDASGETLARTLTTDNGTFRLTAPPAARLLRVLRIGFRPAERPLSGSPDSAAYQIALERLPTMLAPARVVDDAGCRRREDSGLAMGFWDQARAELLAAVIQRDMRNGLPMTVLAYERDLGEGRNQILRQRVQAHTGESMGRPFGAVRNASTFTQTGFVDDAPDGAVFYAPDADVLLEPAFLRSHCLLLRPSVKGSGLVGVGFSPKSVPRGRVDVDGTLWIDTVARRLRSIEFAYVGLPRGITSRSPGGHVRFAVLPDSSVVIDQWSMRIIGAHTDTVSYQLNNQPITTEWYDAHEAGGELARVTWPDGRTWTAPLGRLMVVVTRDDRSVAPGVTVRLAGTSYSAVTDARGRAEINDLLPGPYEVSMEDSLLAVIGTAIPTGASFTAARTQTTMRTIVLQSAEDFAIASCRKNGAPVELAALQVASLVGKDSGLIAGARLVAGHGRLIARVTLDGRPVAGVNWNVWRVTAVGSLAAAGGGRTGSDGLIFVCSGIPVTRFPTDIVVRAWREHEEITVALKPTENVIVLPLALKPKP